MISFNGAFTAEDLRATFHGLGRDIFFLQIGAMDGVSFDPIHEFVGPMGWRGLLVEPVPYMHERLLKTYEGNERLGFEKRAVTDFEGVIEMTILPPETKETGLFTDGAYGTSTVMSDRGLLAGKNLLPEHKELFFKHKTTINVPCCRLKTMLQDHSIGKVDLVVIDTEGADWMIVRQLDLETYHPRAVYLEYNHLSPYEQTACAEHFRNHGYRIYIEKERKENFLAVRAA